MVSLNKFNCHVVLHAQSLGCDADWAEYQLGIATRGMVLLPALDEDACAMVGCIHVISTVLMDAEN